MSPMEKGLSPCRSFSLNFCAVRIGLTDPQAVVLLWVLIVCECRRNKRVRTARKLYGCVA